MQLTPGERRTLQALLARLEARFGGERILGVSLDAVTQLAATPSQRRLMTRVLTLRPSDIGVSTPAVGAGAAGVHLPGAVIAGDVSIAELLSGAWESGLGEGDVVRLVGQHYYSVRQQREAEVRPPLVSRAALSALAALQQAALAELDHPLLVMSQYRSHGHQLAVILRELGGNGGDLAAVLAGVALPGYSQHGDVAEPAFDFGNREGHIGDEFRGTPDYAWLLANAQRFGFHLSYPDGNTSGIKPEPWHWQLRRRVTS